MIIRSGNTVLARRGVEYLGRRSGMPRLAILRGRTVSMDGLGQQRVANKELEVGISKRRKQIAETQCSDQVRDHCLYNTMCFGTVWGKGD